jgi:hypothetical protein
MKLKISDFPSERLKSIGRISKKWKMPLGMTEHQLFTILTFTMPDFDPEDKCHEDNCGCNHIVSVEEIIKYYAMLIDLNPKLKAIPVDDYDDQWQVILGAISRFGADDIQSFIEGYNYSIMNEEDRDVVEEVENLLEVDLGGYCPSPKTLKKMKKWLQKQE